MPLILVGVAPAARGRREASMSEAGSEGQAALGPCPDRARLALGGRMPLLFPHPGFFTCFFPLAGV